MARRNLARAEKCIHCRRGGWRCLNRSLRVLNFAIECEAEAKQQGSFMIARLAHALFDLVRHSREWEPQHFAVITTLCESIKHLADQPESETALGLTLAGQKMDELLEDVVAWVSWLEEICEELKRKPASFDCLRRPSRSRASSRCDG